MNILLGLWQRFFFSILLYTWWDFTILISLLLYPWCISLPHSIPLAQQQCPQQATHLNNLSQKSEYSGTYLPPPPSCSPLPERQLSPCGTPPCQSSLIKMTNTLSNFTIHRAITSWSSHLISTITREEGKTGITNSCFKWEDWGSDLLRIMQLADGWINEDSHHGFLSQNLPFLTADAAASSLFQTSEAICQVTTHHLCHLQLSTSTAVAGLTIGNHLNTPLLGNKTILKTAKQGKGAGGQGRDCGDRGCTYKYCWTFLSGSQLPSESEKSSRPLNILKSSVRVFELSSALSVSLGKM